MAGHVAAAREPVNIADLRRDPRFSGGGRRDSLESQGGSAGYRVVSMVWVPLTPARGDLVGVLQVMNKRLVLLNPVSVHN